MVAIQKRLLEELTISGTKEEIEEASERLYREGYKLVDNLFVDKNHVWYIMQKEIKTGKKSRKIQKRAQNQQKSVENAKGDWGEIGATIAS